MANGVILGQTLNTNGLLPLDGSRAMTGALNMGSHKITNLSNGTANNDAINYYQLMNSTVSASRISGTLSTSNIPNLSASKITSGTFSASRIPDLDASQITSGQFNTARIPNLSASKITSGVLPVARGGTGVNSLDDLGSNFIKKTVLNVDGRVDFFGNNGITELPFLLKAIPTTYLSLHYGDYTQTLFNEDDYTFWTPLYYQMMAYGSRDYMSLIMPIGTVNTSVQLNFQRSRKITIPWEWSGSGTITFYSFV